MIKKGDKKDEKLILSYIGDDFYKCPYLYLDFIKYGTDSKNVSIYIQENDNKVNSLILIYYSGMHIYSKDMILNYEELSKFILDKKPSMICAEKNIILKLSEIIDSYGYKKEFGYVRGMDKLFDETSVIELKEASIDDFDKIVKLLLTDSGLSASYTYDELYKQLIDRFDDKYGRNFVLFDNDKIIGHVCSGAENNKMVILTDLIVDPLYRGMGFGKKICNSFCKIMLSEGKKVFLIAYTQQANDIYDKIGFKIFCEWGKLYLEKNNFNYIIKEEK